MAECCITCQTTKPHRHNKTGFGTVDAPDERFHRVHIDLVGPLSPFREHRFIVWITSDDGVKPSRWSTATPRPSSSLSCKSGLLDLAHHGLSKRSPVPGLT